MRPMHHSSACIRRIARAAGRLRHRRAAGRRRRCALVNAGGQPIGTVRAWQTAGGVTFRIAAAGLPHGIHGIHVHAVGRCDPPDFASAGPHWNPTGKKHGFNNPPGPHAGDLPNVTSPPTACSARR